MKLEETDLVIVGGGVPGLMMAAEASRRGLRARIVHETSSSSRPSRGVLFHPKALASLARLDLFDAARDRAALLERIRLFRHGSSEPAVVLDYQDVGLPFPFALAIEWQHLESILVGTFAKYRAVFREPGVELEHLLREHGRVRGIVGRTAEGEVRFRAHAVIVASDSDSVLFRTELSRRRPGIAYRASHVAFHVPRPPAWPASLDVWLGGGLVIASYPFGVDQLQLEVTGATATVGQALSLGAASIRNLIFSAAPQLESTLGDNATLPDYDVATPAHGRARSWVGDAQILLGPAAYQLSPCGFNGDTQAVLDAAAVSATLSRGTFKGDFSRLALEPYEQSRREAVAIAATLSNDLHRLGLAESGLEARFRDNALNRLGDSAAARAQLVRSLSGFGNRLSTKDRLRLAGILPMPKPTPVVT